MRVLGKKNWKKAEYTLDRVADEENEFKCFGARSSYIEIVLIKVILYYLQLPQDSRFTLTFIVVNK